MLKPKEHFKWDRRKSLCKCTHNLPCNALAEPAQDRRHLCPGSTALGGQRGGAGTVDQTLGIGPADGVYRIGADLGGISVLAQVCLGCGVVTLVLGVAIQNGSPAHG